jgi:hypothetical protein
LETIDRDQEAAVHRISAASCYQYASELAKERKTGHCAIFGVGGTLAGRCLSGFFTPFNRNSDAPILGGQVHRRLKRPHQRRKSAWLSPALS